MLQVAQEPDGLEAYCRRGLPCCRHSAGCWGALRAVAGTRPRRMAAPHAQPSRRPLTSHVGLGPIDSRLCSLRWCRAELGGLGWESVHGGTANVVRVRSRSSWGRTLDRYWRVL